MTIEGGWHKTDRNGYPNVFNVEHNEDGLWLNGNNANPDNFYNADNVWVFGRNFLYFSRKKTGVLILVETFYPATEHPANFLQYLRKS